MNLILLGPPGSGKGTQAKELAKAYSLQHLSTGDLLRAAVKAENSLGKEAKKYMDKGSLVPDEVVIGLIKEKMAEEKDFILDGFPRTVQQATALKAILHKNGRKIDFVINLSVEDAEIVTRLSGRLQCANGHVFNLSNQSVKDGQLCDTCGQELKQRIDDKKETVQNRLDVYRKQTEPLIAYYEEEGKLYSVQGEGDPETVFGAIKAEVDR